MAGQTVECPQCGQSLRLPDAPATPVIRRAPAAKGPLRRTGRTSPTSPTHKSKPKKRDPRPLVFLLLLLLAAGGGWFWWHRRAPAPAAAQGPQAPAAPGALVLASAAGPARPAAAAATEVQAARVTAFQWGGVGKDSTADLAARGDGRLVLTGLIADRSSIPAAAKTVHDLIDRNGTGPFAFVAELSADGQDLNWFSVFGGGLIEPKRLALGPDGSIAVGGKALDRLKAMKMPGLGEFTGQNAVVAKIAADGSKVEWMRAGAPNQSDVTGIAVDAQGRVAWTAGTLGAQQGAYVMRRAADGGEAPFTARGDRSWCIDLHHNTEDLLAPGQFWAFYRKSREAPDQYYDYDGPSGWAGVRYSVHGMRQGGQVIVLPDGDYVVSATMQYDFQLKGDKRYPAFDLFLARYSGEGALRWSTNLYQPNDSVHVPDQKAADLAYNPVNGDVYVLAMQHGSNVYRFKGDLYGDTGNLMIRWIGQVDAATGNVKAGRYFMDSYQGKYDAAGRPQAPPYPKLAGNSLNRVAVDGAGRILVAGNAGAKAWTSPQAWKAWPNEQSGGGNAALYVLSPGLDAIPYASMILGSQGGQASAEGLAVTDAGVWVAGHNRGPGFATPDRPAWSLPEPAGESDIALARFRFE
jgi:hypothetical protein